MRMDAPVAALRAALEAGEPAILVTVAEARGGATVRSASAVSSQRRVCRAMPTGMGKSR